MFNFKASNQEIVTVLAERIYRSPPGARAEFPHSDRDEAWG